MNCGVADAAYGFTRRLGGRHFRSGSGFFFTESALTESSTTSDIAANYRAADFPVRRQNIHRASILTYMWMIPKVSAWKELSTDFEL
jgi:hypothetical protein